MYIEKTFSTEQQLICVVLDGMACIYTNKLQELSTRKKPFFRR
jgi:hypothetical protein